MSQRLIDSLDEIRTIPEITLGNIAEKIEEDALVVVSLVAILPFMQPIPIPGVSSVLGFIVFLQGIGLIIWSKPILTMRLRKVHISHERFEMIYKAALKFSAFTSKISILKSPLTNTRICHVLCGLSIVFSAAFLSLPLPIPFSNLIPALSIFFICVGLLEEDIALLLCGHTINLAVIWMAVFSFSIISEKINSWF